MTFLKHTLRQEHTQVFKNDVFCQIENFMMKFLSNKQNIKTQVGNNSNSVNLQPKMNDIGIKVFILSLFRFRCI